MAGGIKSEYHPSNLVFDYIKVYRLQPEPEFVYLSDARIPPVITGGMVRHDRKQYPRAKRDVLFDETDVVRPAADQRSNEETYYRFRGEEILKSSRLGY